MRITLSHAVAALAAAVPLLGPPASAAVPAPANKIHPALRTQTGLVDVVVRLRDKPLAAVVGKNAKQLGPRLTPAQQRAYVARLRRKQDEVARTLTALGGGEQARVRLALNAVIATIDAAQLERLAALGNVAAINPVVDYEMSLPSTVPYIGGRAVHDGGNQGAGTVVAVLDSGIDYTHAALGGGGTPADYAAAYGAGPADPLNTTRDGLFPTAKVIEGFDFVGEVWPGGPLAPDPDPIDFEGHGTHVADIIAGGNGVAPEAKLLALKVCSAVASSCSGIAIAQAYDYLLDPDGDDVINVDALPDVVNMSLGASYGQIEVDDALAVAVLTDFGITFVCSAGNSGDRPYITGTPSAAPEALGVAQTQVPGATANVLKLTGNSNQPVFRRNTAGVPWAPIDADVSGQIVRVSGLACTPLAPGSLTGKIALIDRGTCNVSFKVDHAARAGAIGVIIANNVAGDPPTFSFGGTSDGAPFMAIPTIIVTQTDGNYIKASLTRATSLGRPYIASFGPGITTGLDMSMVASSSRGPGYGTQLIKPEIGAPGASVSAVAGTGTDVAAFGGTSGAAPMVAGSAALVIAAKPGLTPLEVKAHLMNSAETEIYINPAGLPGVLAPITRIGAGEVRVNRAVGLKGIAYEEPVDGEPFSGRSAALSYGFKTLHLATVNTFTRTVRVRNYTADPRSYDIASAFRYANDAASGAVLVTAPASVAVPPGGEATFDVTLAVDPAKLPNWTLNVGPNGGAGPLLQTVEFDGYLTLSAADGETLSVPWHILPRRSADVTAFEFDDENVAIVNPAGAQAGITESFSLVGTSPQDYPAGGFGLGSQVAAIDLKEAGLRKVRSGGADFVQVAVTTYDPRSHAVYPASFEVYFDTNRDGTYDYVAFTTENGAFATSGQAVVAVGPLPSGPFNVRTFVDGDLNSANVILTVPLADLGITGATQFDCFVAAFDNYFTGTYLDFIPLVGEITHTLDQPAVVVPFGGFSIPAAGGGLLPYTVDPAGLTASPSNNGLLFLHRAGVIGRESDAIILVEPGE
jgi:subtilisin family serine protease